MGRAPRALLNDDAEHWRDRAEEARGLAQQITDSEARRMMLVIAADYDWLAERAKQRKLVDKDTE